jgi:HK97 family phage major capsid protein
MLNLAQLERDRAEQARKAKDLLAETMRTAETENREMTAEETGAIEAIAVKVREMQARIEKARGFETLTDELNRYVSHGDPTARPRKAMKSLGQQWAESDAMEFIRQKHHRAQSAWRTPSVELFDPRAATLTEDPASGGALVLPQQIPGIVPTLFRRLVVADLLASGTTTSNAVSYMQETLFTNAAAAVLEGGVKPESTLTFEAVTDLVRKIAHWLPVSEEMLEDVAQIRSYIDARLTLGVELAEEDEILNGSGVAPHLLGLRTRPGLAADVVRGAAETNADAIFRQAMAIFSASFLMPTGVVMNPADWATTALMKTTTGEYLAGGPFSPAITPTLWGMAVAVTPVMTATVAFVGAFKQAAQIFRHGGIRVEASNSHADFFIKNLVAIRAEERLALAVYRPAAMGEVTGLGVPA